MKISLEHNGRKFLADFDEGIDLSSTLGKPGEELKAWGVPDVKKEPVSSGDWIGSVDKGSPVNFYNIHFNPHGNGTHTESYGHISREQQSVNQLVSPYHFIARLVHLEPEQRDEDQVVSLNALKSKIEDWDFEALILKTGPCRPGYDFTGKNPTYFEGELLRFLREKNIRHFLTDLPSVDREEDGGRLLSHKAFWNYPDDPVEGATITELLLIPDEIAEGLYLLNLQVAPFHNDASPSRPVIYPLREV